MKKSDLTIVILTYNSQYWLDKTLSTLREHYIRRSNRSIEVVVVDNKSTDDSVRMVKKEFSWARLVELEENKGFAAGNNVVLKESTSTYTMLLNSDVEFTPASNLDPLLDFLDENPLTAVVTPRVEFLDGTLDPASHRGEPTLWASFTYFSGLAKLFPHSKTFAQYHQTYEPLNRIHPVDACSGAAMIVRTSSMKKIGYLDERFFMYAEDLDWCKRFREAGFQIIFHPGATVIHHKYKSGISSSSRQLARQTKRHFYDTMLIYYDKHYRSRYPEFVRTGINYLVEMKKGGL